MAYTIIKSDGNVLTTIADGTLNTANTSLGLPGRNYAGYGNVLDTNFVRLLENFADGSVPSNPIRGQLWCDISNVENPVLRLCKSDGDVTVNNWIVLSSSTSAGNSQLGNLTVTGDAHVYGNLTVDDTISTDNIVANTVTVNDSLTSANITATSANLATIITGNITSLSGGAILNGNWTVNSNTTYNKNILFANSSIGIRCDNYMYANGQPFNPAGTYTNANVANYLPNYSGNVGNGIATFYGNVVSTGANTNTGTITGNWTLSTGSKLNSTYADLAERFESDAYYEPGTVVELGGEKEITAVKDDLSENVFGVISDTAGYVMNGAVGNDTSHPPVALAGRVNVKVIGSVNRFDRLVSAGNGMARAGKKEELTTFNVIGRALAAKEDSGVGVIEAVVFAR